MNSSGIANPSNKHEMSNSKILVDIYNALQRLESSLDDQHTRIRTIEGSIRSNGSSPTHGKLSSIASSMSEEKDLSDLPRSVESAESASFFPPGYKSSDYEASVLKLFKRRFEFMDDSCSELESNKSSEEPKEDKLARTIKTPQSFVESIDKDSLSAPWNRDRKNVPDLDNFDAYSQSIYSSRPLSRFELDIPPVSPVPEESGESSGRYSLYDTPALPVSIPAVGRSISIRAQVAAFSRSVPSFRFRKSGSGMRSKAASSVNSAESSGSQSHERAEISLHAYDNLKNSIYSFVSFRSKERVARREETKRLKGLSLVRGNGSNLDSAHSEKHETEGNGALATLHSLLGQLGEFSINYYRAKRSIATGMVSLNWQRCLSNDPLSNMRDLVDCPSFAIIHSLIYFPLL
ncbi:hypothetical protein BKA65DRAFT_563025 [Rhexocercosporidium sp. MPI-PUGE-AT-0058]|nr:hypothetical protein BKA65DRAFT_563025 [Rhexocercosporidium sp. MPI-PUGE-AT-0058]